jgi:hypothetical protein
MAAVFIQWTFCRACSTGVLAADQSLSGGGRTLSASQLVTIGTAQAITVLLFEIPTGVMADTIGCKELGADGSRRGMVALGALAWGVDLATAIAASGTAMWLLGFVVLRFDASTPPHATLKARVLSCGAACRWREAIGRSYSCLRRHRAWLAVNPRSDRVVHSDHRRRAGAGRPRSAHIRRRSSMEAASPARVYAGAYERSDRACAAGARPDLLTGTSVVRATLQSFLAQAEARSPRDRNRGHGAVDQHLDRHACCRRARLDRGRAGLLRCRPVEQLTPTRVAAPGPIRK